MYKAEMAHLDQIEQTCEFRSVTS